MAILSGGTDLYDIFATSGVGISGSGTNNTVPLWDGSTNLDDSILTQAGSVITCTGDLNTTNGIRFSTEQGSSFVMKRISIGDWDMDADQTKSVAHGLSNTERKTMFNLSCVIRHDSDTPYYDLLRVEGALQGGAFDNISSTNVTLFRSATGGFNNSNFNSTSYNRGFITFWYIKD